jgi:hypothetical protein
VNLMPRTPRSSATRNKDGEQFMAYRNAVVAPMCSAEA